MCLYMRRCEGKLFIYQVIAGFMLIGSLWTAQSVSAQDKPFTLPVSSSIVTTEQSSVQIETARVLKPKLTAVFDEEHPAPLYPVYAWEPLPGAVAYEVEVLAYPPENPNGTARSLYRLWSEQVTWTTCYDKEPRLRQSTYYWRVRGIDAEGNPVGVYSDVGKVMVNPRIGNYAATFGDSLTHGGGDDYSPADRESNYQTYLDFRTANLGRSGDTTAKLVARFQRDVIPYHPRYLLILGGTNSLRGNTSAASVIADLINLREQCYAAGIRPIFLTIPPINPTVMREVIGADTHPNWRQKFDIVNQFIRQQPYFVDIAPLLENEQRELDRELASDGLHPGMEGKQRMAAAINAKWEQLTR